MRSPSLTLISHPKYVLARTMRQVRWTVRDYLIRYPAYLHIARLRYREGRPEREYAADTHVVRPDTRLVLEGFPRSGNTFAVTAFKLAQPHPVRLANHLHAPAQIIQAARWKIPCVVLIRDPEDAALSVMIQHWTCLTARQTLRAYVGFYRSILPYRDWFVTASFERVTTDFGSVVRRVNTRFGTSFGVFEHSAANVRTCFDLIEADNQVRHEGRIKEMGVARPSVERDALKERLRTTLRDRSLHRLRAEAYALYHQYAGLEEKPLVIPARP